MNAKHVVIALVIVAAAAHVGLSTQTQLEATNTIRWPEEGVRYELTYRGTNETSFVGKQKFTGALELEADLVIAGRGEGQASLAFTSVREHRMQLNGDDILPDAGPLLGQHALIDFAETGEVTAVRFEEGATKPFRHVMQHLLAEIQFRATPGEFVEKTPHGLAEALYEARDGVIEKTRTRYTALRVAKIAQVDPDVTLDARYAFELDRGVLQRFEGAESLRVVANAEPIVTAETLVKLVRAAGAPEVRSLSAALLAAPAEEPGEAKPSKAAEQELLRRRTNGMTAHDVLAGIGSYGDAGELPDHSRWLWQAAAVLEMHPELSNQLADLASDPDATLARQLLITDLLASVGHPEAQSALRQIVSSPEAKTKGAFHHFVQRAGFVKVPEPETAQLLQSIYADSSGRDHYAAAYAVGSVAGALARRGDTDLAATLNEALTSELYAATAPQERVHLLKSLGNAALAENADVVASFASDDDAGVRSAAATALRGDSSATATEALLALGADDVQRVQRAAFRAIGKRALHGAELANIEAAVKDGSIHEPTFVALARNLTAQDADVASDVDRILTAMIARGIQSPKLRTHVEGMLHYRQLQANGL